MNVTSIVSDGTWLKVLLDTEEHRIRISLITSVFVEKATVFKQAPTVIISSSSDDTSFDFDSSRLDALLNLIIETVNGGNISTDLITQV